MDEQPYMILIYLGVAIFAGKMWWDDYSSAKRGNPNPKAFPGATGAPSSIVIIGAIVALVLVGIETVGEYILGVSGEQNTYPYYILAAWVAAGFVEELIFRGFLVVDKKGKAALWGSIMGFSFIFAIIHLHWLDGELFGDSEEPLALNLSAKAIWSTAILFVNSLFFYILRFNAKNPERSLIPCFVAHAVSNIGVFAVKLAQGHITF